MEYILFLRENIGELENTSIFCQSNYDSKRALQYVEEALQFKY